MKLNLVADYVVPGTSGKRFVASFAIDASNNLMKLSDMVSMSFPAYCPTCTRRPETLTMCESAKKAESVASAWRADYKRDGRLWDYSPIDAYQAYKKSEEESWVAK